jgi:hypothetical protein
MGEYDDIRRADASRNARMISYALGMSRSHYGSLTKIGEALHSIVAEFPETKSTVGIIESEIAKIWAKNDYGELMKPSNWIHLNGLMDEEGST